MKNLKYAKEIEIKSKHVHVFSSRKACYLLWTSSVVIAGGAKQTKPTSQRRRVHLRGSIVA